MDNKAQYQSPEIEEVDIILPRNLCEGSPDPGYNEDVNYDDWVV